MANNPPPSNNDKNIQYASSTPSVASLLNLPQVQDKKKQPVAGLATGVIGIKSTPGLKTTTPGLVGKPLTLGLKKTTPVAVVPLTTNNTEIKTAAVVTEPKPVPLDKPLSTAPVHAKVEKPKVSVHKDKQEYKKISNINVTDTPKSANIANPSNPTNPSKPMNQLTDQFDPSHWRLFVGNLGPEVTDTLLLTTFQNPYPSCSKALIIRDWKSQKSKGYGFVAFKEGKEFLRALKEMQGKWIGNRQAIIKKSDHQPTFNKQ